MTSRKLIVALLTLSLGVGMAAFAADDTGTDATTKPAVTTTTKKSKKKKKPAATAPAADQAPAAAQ